MTRKYSELSKLKTYEERYRYLKLTGSVGEKTFGFDRYLNQILYKLPKWSSARARTIIRDNGCDLGIDGRVVNDKILVHHMNPITLEDVLKGDPKVFDEEYLISTSLNTHNAIHYGDESLLVRDPVERTRNDTCPWKKG